MISATKNRAMLTVNVIFISLIFILNYFYQRAGFDFTLKCITSAIFAILGVINLVYVCSVPGEHKNFCLGMSVGLIMAFLGDVLIKFNFIIGAAVFALGHICFVVAYTFLVGFRLMDFVISAILFLGTFVFLMFYPPLEFNSLVTRIVCIK